MRNKNKPRSSTKIPHKDFSSRFLSSQSKIFSRLCFKPKLVFFTNIPTRLCSFIFALCSFIPRLTSFFFALCSFFFLLSSSVSFAQTTPVFGNLQLTPPYSLTLSDYTVATEDRLVLSLLLTDQSIDKQDVLLRIKIEGNGVTIQTKPGFVPLPISLFTNTPEILTGNDLYQYFANNNLDFQGLDMEKFRKTGQLPEGLYRFSIEAYDYNRKVLVSNKASANAWLVLNDPPRWNLPMDNSKIIATNPQNIMLQWLPMHTGSPNAAFTTEYELTIVELWNQGSLAGGAASFDAIRSQTPFLRETVLQSSFILGPAEQTLTPGKKYAAVVRAIANNGLDLFKNNGYSAVLTFTFGDECLPVQNLVLTASGMTTALATWDIRPGNTSFKVQNRPLGNPNWYGGAEETVVGRYTLQDFAAGSTYEVSVQASCGTVDSPERVIARITMPVTPQGVQVCGPSTPTVITNLTPVNTLRVGDVVQAGGQPLRITELTPKGEGYDGKAVWKMGWLGNASLQSAFSNMKVNSDGVAFAGRVWVEGAGSLKSQVVNQIVDKIPGAAQLLAQADAKLAEAEEIVQNYSDNLPADVKRDLLAAIAQVRAGKNAVLAGNVQEGASQITSGVSKLNSAATKAVKYAKNAIATFGQPKRDSKVTSHPNIAISFRNATTSKYGFDAKTKEELADKYEKVTDQTTNADLYIGWKAVEAEKVETIDVQVTSSSAAFKADSVKFVRDNEAKIPSTPSLAANTKQLTVYGNSDGIEGSVYAVYSNTSGGQNLAKLNLISYEKVTKKLYLVPLKGATVNAQEIKTALNTIYSQAVASFDVEAKPSFTPPKSTIDVGNSGLLSTYTADMQAIIDAYQAANSDVDEEDFYLFIGGTPSDAGQKGYMPRAKHFGFIFSPDSKTISHELGHGVFHLKHTFSETSVAQGSSDNLMDYGTGTFLNKYQWDAVHDPELVVGLFESDKAGALSNIDGDFIKEVIVLLKRKYAESKNITRNELVGISTVFARNDWGSGSINQYKIGSLEISKINFRNEIINANASINPKNIIKRAVNTRNIQQYEIVIDQSLSFSLPNELAQNALYDHLIHTDLNNLIVFVNGYRDIGLVSSALTQDNPRHNDNIYNSDIDNYWLGIDVQFMDAIGNYNAYYADGHDDITTSNHYIPNPNATTKEAKIKIGKEAFIDNMLTALDVQLLVTDECFHKESCLNLHTTPNVAGFNTRFANGKKAGHNLWLAIQAGNIKAKLDATPKIAGKVDIVAHSMGFAYSLGMIEELKTHLAQGVKFGRFYILAPENAESGTISASDYEEVWQYGSNENGEKNYNQDGVAPQKPVTGIGTKRAFYPVDGSKHRGFLVSHKVINYDWIFNTLKGKSGEVKKRE